MAILWPQPSFMASGHILPSLAFLANSHFTNPQVFIFDFGPGGLVCLLGASKLPSHHPWIQRHPFHYWGFGLNGLFRPFRPPMAPTALGLWAAVRRPKGAKGVSHLGPKARWVSNPNWAHLSQSWPPLPWTQK
ncbi:hypothetical protein O181_047083 [Austropuccinia psidii MF-1]|uniref:Uncharacterized protein n=1 Tax=Austropuccinia psidii MF-1 TaxID=1389203 RepID=A0A9Q3HJ60_9BASI|nr:hypothetical protein [Austropuccinia psidii MF-1]